MYTLTKPSCVKSARRDSPVKPCSRGTYGHIHQKDSPASGAGKASADRTPLDNTNKEVVLTHPINTPSDAVT